MATPGIGRENTDQLPALTDHSVREAPRRGRQYRRAATAVTLRADPRTVDLGQCGKHGPRCKHIVGAGCERKLCLIGDG